MTLTRQPDLFLKEVQPDLLEDQPAPRYGGDPDRVRAHLRKILDIARTAKRLSSSDLRLYPTIFPQMVGWLPAEEARELLCAFEAEIQRLEAA